MGILGRRFGPGRLGRHVGAEVVGKLAGHGVDCRIGGHFVRRHADLQVAADALEEVEADEGVHAESGQVAVVGDGFFGNAQEACDLLLQVVLEACRALRHGHGAELFRKPRGAGLFAPGLGLGLGLRLPGLPELAEHGRAPGHVENGEHAAPVHLRHDLFGGALVHKTVEDGHAGGCVEALDALLADAVEDAEAHDRADVAPGAPVDGKAWLEVCPAHLDEGVHEGVGRDVVGLAVRAEDRGDGREDHEMVELHAARHFVHEPAAVDLGAENGVEALPVKLHDDVVVQEACKVEDALERRFRALDMRRKEGCDGIPVGHVDDGRADLAAQRLNGLDLGFSLGACLGQPASEQPQVPCAPLGEVLGQGEADFGEAAGDDVGGVGAHAPGSRFEGISDHDLADVAAFHHIAEGVHGLVHGEDPALERMVDTLFEALHDAGEDALKRSVLPGAELFEIDDEVLDARVHGLRLLGRAHVGLADLDVAAAGLDAAHGGVGKLLHEEIEGDIDAFAAGGLQNLLLKDGGTGGEDAGNAHGSQQGALAGRACGGDDIGTDVPGNLDGREPHAARGRVQEDGLALLELRRLDEGVPRRHEAGGDACGLDVRQAVGRLGREGGLGAQMAGEGSVGRGHDAVADGKALDLSADRRDLAGAVQHHDLDGVGNAHGDHDVAEVLGPGADFELNLVVLGRRPIEGLDADVLDAVPGKVEGKGLAFGTLERLRPGGLAGRLAPDETRRLHLSCAQGYLVFLRAFVLEQGDDGGQLLLRLGLGIEIDDQRAELVQLVGDRLFEAPQQALRRHRDVGGADGLRLAGHDGQAGTAGELAGAHGVHEMEEGLGRAGLEAGPAAVALEVRIVEVQAPEEEHAEGLGGSAGPFGDHALEVLRPFRIDFGHAGDGVVPAVGDQGAVLALRLERVGQIDGEAGLAVGEDKPGALLLRGLGARQGGTPDDVVEQVAVLLLAGLEQLEGVLAGALHGQVDDFADQPALGREDLEGGGEHVLLEGVALLHSGLAPDRFGRLAVEDDLLDAEGHEAAAGGIAGLGGQRRHHALQAAVEHGGMADEGGSRAFEAAAQDNLGHGAAAGAPEPAQAPEDGAVLHGAVGVELVVVGGNVHLLDAFGPELFQISRLAGLVGEEGGHGAGHVQMPVAAGSALACGLAEDLELGAALGRRHEHLQIALPAVEHERLAQDDVFERDLVGAEVVHAGRRRQIEVACAGHDNDVEDLVLLQEGLEPDADAGFVLGDVERRGQARAEQRVAGRFARDAGRGGLGLDGLVAEGSAGRAAGAGHHDVLVEGLVRGIGEAGELVEAGLGQGLLPALGGQEGTVAAEGLVGQRVEQAAEGDFEAHGRTGRGDLAQEEDAAVAQKLLEVGDGLLEIGRRMEHVGADDGIELALGKALGRDLAADVERPVLDEGILGEAALGVEGEDHGDVGEDVAGAVGGQNRQDGRGRAAGAGADFKDGQLAVQGQAVHEGADGAGHDVVVVEALGRVLVDAFDGVEVAAREHDFPRIRLSAQDAAKVGAAPAHEGEQRLVGADKGIVLARAAGSVLGIFLQHCFSAGLWQLPAVRTAGRNVRFRNSASRRGRRLPA